jgi:hypothetical protein
MALNSGLLATAVPVALLFVRTAFGPLPLGEQHWQRCEFPLDRLPLPTYAPYAQVLLSAAAKSSCSHQRSAHSKRLQLQDMLQGRWQIGTTGQCVVFGYPGAFGSFVCKSMQVHSSMSRTEHQLTPALSR